MLAVCALAPAANSAGKSPIAATVERRFTVDFDLDMHFPYCRTEGADLLPSPRRFMTDYSSAIHRQRRPTSQRDVVAKFVSLHMLRRRNTTARESYLIAGLT